METLTLPIGVEEKSLLHLLAQTRHRSDEESAVAALRDYLRFEAEQIRRVREGVDAAERGDFADEEEVAAFFRRYGESG